MEKQATHEQDWIEELLPPQGENGKGSAYMFQATGREVWQFVKKIMQKAQRVKITIWHGDRPLAVIPAVYGGFAAAIFPFISLFSMISLLALNCKIIVEKR